MKIYMSMLHQYHMTLPISMLTLPILIENDIDASYINGNDILVALLQHSIILDLLSSIARLCNNS